MKRVLSAAAATLVLLLAGGVQADENLVKTNGCMACHGLDKKLLGPGFKEVANKYRGTAGAEAALAKKIKEGGKGAWGDYVMPPQAHVKDADIAAIVKWTMSLK